MYIYIYICNVCRYKYISIKSIYEVFKIFKKIMLRTNTDAWYVFKELIV